MMMTVPPPEKLDAQNVDKQRSVLSQFLASLLRRCGGWYAAMRGEPSLPSSRRPWPAKPSTQKIRLHSSFPRNSER